MNAHIPEEEQTKVSGNLEMNLYDLNKQVIAQMPDLTKDQIIEKVQVFKEYDNQYAADYYMMLCNDLHYYTLFKVYNFNPSTTGLYPFWEEVIMCLDEFADSIKSIELTENKDAIEIWIKQDDEVYVMYFFNYDFGVIDCER